MATIEIVFDHEGRIVRPQGVLRLRLPAQFVVTEEIEETNEEREERVTAFFNETRETLKDAPRKELCDTDPLVAKYRRMGLLD